MRAIVIGLVLAGGVAQAGIYKCEAGGEIVYQQQPCKKITVKVIKGSSINANGGFSRNDAISELKEVNRRAKQTGDDCLVVEYTAGLVMKMRQDGVSMSELMHATDDSGNQQAIDLTRLYVELAFKEPRWHTERSKKRAIQDFKEQMYKACRSNKK